MNGQPHGQSPHAQAPHGHAGPETALSGRIGIVRNPRSHRNKGHAVVPHEDARTITVVPGNRDELTGVLERFAREGVGAIIVDGGDGTVRDLLTRGDAIYCDDWPALMVLPKGKTNALAIDLGLPGRFPLEEGLGVIDHAHTVVRRPIRVEHVGAGDPPVLGFIMGSGVFNAAIDAGRIAHGLGGFQGLAVGITAAIGMGRALFGSDSGPWRALTPTRVCPAPDGEDVPHSAHGVPGQRYATGFSTLEAFPLGMRPFSGTGPGIRYLVFDAPLRRVLARVPMILKGAHPPFYTDLGIHRGSADEIALELGGHFILDGESFPPGDYVLRLGPELRFLVP